MTKRHYENVPKIAKLLCAVKYQGILGAKSCRTNAITFILHLPQGHALQKAGGFEKDTKKNKKKNIQKMCCQRASNSGILELEANALTVTLPGSPLSDAHIVNISTAHIY